MATGPKKVTVVLTSEHTHRGLVFPPGTEIELREDQAERLERDRKAIRKEIYVPPESGSDKRKSSRFSLKKKKAK